MLHLILRFALLGFLAVRVPVLVFAYTPSLQHKPVPLFATISILAVGVLALAMRL